MADRRSTAIWVALIGMAGVVIAAVIGYLATRPHEPNGKDPDIQYTGKVIDKRTKKPISGASVSIETQGPPQNYFTDSNGIFSVMLKPTIKSVRIKVEAQGYPIFDSNVSPTSRTELEDIRLERPEGEAAVTLPEGLTLKDAIEFAAKLDEFGVQYIGSCNPQLMKARVQGGTLRGKDMGEIIQQLRFRLGNANIKSSYQVTKVVERKVYQIECTN